MHDALLVGVVQRVGDLDGDLDRFGNGQALFALEAFVE